MAILKFLILLFLSLYFVPKVPWDDGASTRLGASGHGQLLLLPRSCLTGMRSCRLPTVHAWPLPLQPHSDAAGAPWPLAPQALPGVSVPGQWALCTGVGHGVGPGPAVQTLWCLRMGCSSGALCPGLAASFVWWGKASCSSPTQAAITSRQRIFDLLRVGYPCWVGVADCGEGRQTSSRPERAQYVGQVAAGRRAQWQVGLLSQAGHTLQVPAESQLSQPVSPCPREWAVK